MVAGILVGLRRGYDIPDAVRYGIAAGSAAVMTPGTELCRREDVGRLWADMKA
jgi:6-phosphofructokinase 2